VPCRFCKEIFSQVTNKPIEVCWHGTDLANYQYHDRTGQRTAEGKFRFLWCGAPNPRKGYQEVLAMTAIAEKNPDIELYMKTTVPKITWFDTLRSLKKNWRKIFDFKDYNKDAAKKGMVITKNHPSDWRRAFWLNLLKIPRPSLYGKIRRFGKHKNIVMDTRMLSKQELVQLYKDANCFILPTWGEGWGLTLSEAMATGCPSIATRVTGVKEFFDDTVGYEIKHYVQQHELRDYNMSARVYKPFAPHLADRMLHVYSNYEEALKKGKAAADRMRTQFTWEQSAHRIAQIIRRHYVYHKNRG